MTKLIRMKELFKIAVPRLEYLSLKDEYIFASRRIESFPTYFPDYQDSKDGYNPPREYFWNVFFTLEPVHTELRLKFHIKYERRAKAFAEGVIPIRQDIFEMITQKTIIPSKH